MSDQDQVRTVLGKAGVFLNNLPVADQPGGRRQEGALYDFGAFLGLRSAARRLELAFAPRPGQA